MTLLTSWSPFFQSSVRIQGRSLQLGEQVLRVEPRDDEVLRAEVKDRTPHNVSFRKEGRNAIAECDCNQFATGQFCRHIWATLLDLEHGEEGPGIQLHELIKLRLRPPKARKRDETARPIQSAEPQWIGRLSLLRPPTSELDAADANIFPVQRQVCYVVLPRLSSRHNGLVVDLRQRTAIASGWGKPKPLKISNEAIATLGDARDREICSLLLGSVWVTQHETAETYGLQRAHSMYRIARGAQRQLLQELISTGRCFIDTDEEGDGRMVPLRWDGEPSDLFPAPPQDLTGLIEDGNTPQAGPNSRTWRLWLHGAFSKSGEVNAIVTREAPEDSDEAIADEDNPFLAEEDNLIAQLDADAATIIDDTEAEVSEDETSDAETKAEDDELMVDVQIRRLGKRMPVAEPDLILGGLDGLIICDGLAAEFDDRDAYRWVTQFREGRYGDREGSKAMVVPKPDVSKFLDRLYTLPNLPEIDLPEGLGRTEHRIEAEPHLEIFNPSSSDAAKLLTNTPGKSSLVARVWFNYGGERVNPAKPGRFVPISGAIASANDVATAEAAEPATLSGETEQVAAETDVVEELEGDVAVETEDAPAPETEEAGETTNEADLDAIHDGRLIRRDRRAEREAIAVLPSLGLRHVSSATGDVLVLPSKQMPHAMAVLLSQGWHVSADRKLVRSAGPPALSITSGIDWFELRGTVRFTRADGQEETFSLPDILRAARSGQSMIQLGDGSQGLLPEQWLQEHGLLTSLGEVDGDHLRFQRSQAAMLDSMLGDQDNVEIDSGFAVAREQIAQFNGIEEVDAHPDFGGSLRAYQRQGLGWTHFLRNFGMGGVLADDMGLGKTVQVLAMLHARLQNGEVAEHRPSLIIVPRSVIFNWLDEAARFTPNLRVLAYSGPDREGLLKSIKDYDVVVTSYGLMRRDVESLQNIPFDYVVLDEAQAIKNPASQSAKAARLLQANHRMALTGTPVENHLGDLWSIFEFLNPGMLGSNARFAELIRAATTGRQRAGASIADPATGGADAPSASADAQADFAAETGAEVPATAAPGKPSRADAIVQIAQSLRPFILRRTKQQVLTDLPKKTEQTLICEMEPAQRKVYDDLRKYYRGTLLKQLDASGNGKSGSRAGMGRSAFMVLEALLRLRQAACHPALINKEGVASLSDLGEAPSAKLDVLDERLADIIDEGSKALVFSQFTSMLSLVRKRLDAQGIRYAYLDGQTRNRKEVVERFQEDPELQVFLISLKAGGVGLNLTAAEYVFILDPWWNPAVEAQAIDRTHRIGQTKPVFAYRLICEDTVEQRIVQLQDHKRRLADAIVGGEQNILSSLTRDDLEILLS